MHKIMLFMIVVMTSFLFADLNEKELFKKSYISIDFRFEKKDKNPGKTKLEVWQPYLDYIKTLPTSLRRSMEPEIGKIDVDYDEIWIFIDESYLTAEEIKKFAGKLNIYKVYWKKDRFLALTQEKSYNGHPITNEKYTESRHQITNIWGRVAFYKQYFEAPVEVPEINENQVEVPYNKTEIQHNKAMAISAARSEIKSRLKAPSTAKFPFGDWKVNHIGDGVYEINSYVDSENSFGVKLRKNFYIKVKVFGFDDYRILEVNTWD